MSRSSLSAPLAALHAAANAALLTAAPKSATLVSIAVLTKDGAVFTALADRRGVSRHGLFPGEVVLIERLRLHGMPVAAVVCLREGANVALTLPSPALREQLLLLTPESKDAVLLLMRSGKLTTQALAAAEDPS